MTSLFVRRIAVCIAAVAVLAVVVPTTASATTDRLEQCAGESIVGRGSTFQNPIQLIWEGKKENEKHEIIPTGFNVSGSKIACAGKHGQGSLGRPTVDYEQGAAEKGSGACLKGFGAEKQTKKPSEVDFCGTDEAPSATQKKEIEEQLSGAPVGEEEGWLETIPVLQGAVAVIVHLPEGCTATSAVSTAPNRLVLDRSTIAEIYRGKITTWKQVEEHQGTNHGSDKINCTPESAKEDEIKTVVRLDKSGTTHIFKSFLLQVNDSKFEAEPFDEINEHAAGKEHVVPCGEERTANADWYEMDHGCENQRWAKAESAEAPNYKGIIRPTVSGNPGVVEEVANQPSSIGYADLAVAREYGYFSKAGEGGEGTSRFWVEVESSEKHGKAKYQDPSTDGDTEAVADSNCKKAEYIDVETGKEYPPNSTRDVWAGALAKDEGKSYPICGLTYDLAFKFYKPFLGLPESEEQKGKGIATTVENYLAFEINAKAGGKEAKNEDYYPLPESILAKDQTGVEEIEY